MIDTEKIYLCTTDDPRQAAILYDIVILQAKGHSSKINFNATKADILAILFERSLVETKKIRTQLGKIKHRELAQIDRK